MAHASIVEEISEYCRSRGLAESTLGRLAANDGKLMSRLRSGGRVNSDTLARLQACMERGVMPRRISGSAMLPLVASSAPSSPSVAPPPAGAGDVEQNFRFFDNRQKYLLFVTTCSEK